MVKLSLEKWPALLAGFFFFFFGLSNLHPARQPRYQALSYPGPGDERALERGCPRVTNFVISSQSFETRKKPPARQAIGEAWCSVRAKPRVPREPIIAISFIPLLTGAALPRYTGRGKPLSGHFKGHEILNLGCASAVTCLPKVRADAKNSTKHGTQFDTKDFRLRHLKFPTANNNNRGTQRTFRNATRRHNWPTETWTSRLPEAALETKPAPAV